MARTKLTELIIRVTTAMPPRAQFRRWSSACKVIMTTQLEVINIREKLKGLDAQCAAGNVDSASIREQIHMLYQAISKKEGATYDAMAALGSSDAELDEARELWASEYKRMRSEHLSIQTIEAMTSAN